MQIYSHKFFWEMIAKKYAEYVLCRIIEMIYCVNISLQW